MRDGAISLNEIGARGRYGLDTGAGEAELTYVLDGERRMVINHTYVPPAARGRDFGLRLVERAVADAKARGMKISPRCGYVARLFDRRKDWSGLRAQ